MIMQAMPAPDRQGYLAWKRFPNSLHTIEFAKHRQIDTHVLEFFAATKLWQVDDEGAGDDLSPEPLNKLDPGLGRAPCRKEIVHDKDFLTGFDRVIVNFDDRFTILKLVVLGDRGAWQLALLADRHETD